MKSFFLVLGFFTHLPVPKTEFTEARYRKALKLIPLVGLAVGAILTGVSLLCYAVQAPAFIRGAILTCVYIFITGGLHFDGLADTCDGIFSGKTREKALEIMKDSRIGVFGALGIFLAGLLYFAFMTEAPLAALLIFPLCGRACCLVSAALAPYARRDGMGKATRLESGPATIWAAYISIIASSLLPIPLAMLVALLEGWITIPAEAFKEGVFAFAPICPLIASGAAILVSVIMTMRFRKKLGGVTGDTFGAVIEVSSLVFLFAFIILNRILPL